MRQCPRCELRFSSGDELDDHLALDHRVAPEHLPDRRGLGKERPGEGAGPDGSAGPGV